MNLLTILNEDFKQLSIESKKKFPAIKEASDRAIVKLKSLGYESPDIVELPKSEEVFNSLIYSIDVIMGSEATDNSTIQAQNKLLGIIISILQSLVSNKALAEDTRIPVVIDKLYALVEKAAKLLGNVNGGGGSNSSEESSSSSSSALSIFGGNSGGENDFLNDENCVKVSRLVVSLISNYTGLVGENLRKALRIAFLMSSIKGSKIVRSAAGSSLMLIFTQIFGRAREAIETPKCEAASVTSDENTAVTEEEKKKEEDIKETKDSSQDKKEDEEEDKKESDEMEDEKEDSDDKSKMENNDDDEKEEKEEKATEENSPTTEPIKEEEKEGEKKEGEEVPKSKTPEPASGELTGILKDTHAVLSDVCFLTARGVFEEGIAALPAKRDPSKYLRIERLDSLLGLDLISDVLANSYVLFERSEAFFHILKDDICKFLILEKVKKILPISSTAGSSGSGLLSKLKSKNARLLGQEFRVYQRVLQICETLVVKDGYLVLIKADSALLFSILDTLDKVIAAENPNGANTFLDAVQILVLELFDKIFTGKREKADYGCDAPTQQVSISNLLFGKTLADILAFVQFKRKNTKKKTEVPLFKYEAYPFQNSKISL